jgi:hypothetical protein
MVTCRFGSLAVAFFLTGQILVSQSTQKPGNQEEPKYDRTTVGTYTGVVSAISSHTGQRGTPRARATLRMDNGTIEIHIGPTSFLDAKGMRLAVGDRIIVSGSQVKQDGIDLVIVSQLTKGTQVLVLRDAQGRGVWGEEYK